MAGTKQGVVIATKNQLESIGISEELTRAAVEIFEIDRYRTIHGLGSKIKFKYEKFDYIIPTCWVDINA